MPERFIEIEVESREVIGKHRVDEAIVFHQLEKKHIVEIVETRPQSRRKRWSLKRVVRQAVEV